MSVGIRLVLYNPRSNRAGKRMLPMSLLALAAVLEDVCECRIIDGNCEADPLQALRAAVRDGATVLAVTVMPGPQLAAALPDCRRLKREFPDLTIVWGGYFPTQHADVVVADPAIDYVVRGHGELVLKQLLARLAAGGDGSGIDGVCYRARDGSPVMTPLPAVPHPETLPDFPYHLLRMEHYVRPTFMGTRTLAHHSSYGCPFRCNFCAVVNMVDGRWLAQSPARVGAVAQRLVSEWGANALEFYDSNFFAQQSRTVDVAGRLSRLAIAWWAEGRIDTLLQYSLPTWQALRRSGLRMVFMGAESASAETLRRMDKGGTASPEKTLAIAARMAEFDIVPEFSFVLGAPPDPDADVRQTLEFVRRLKRVNPRSEIILYHYTPVPLAGDLYASAERSGFAFPRTLDEWADDRWQRFALRYSDGMPWLTSPLRRRVRDFQRVLNAYYPTSTDASLTATRRLVLRAASAWRYHSRLYALPFELRALHRLFAYQRPETSGF